MGGTNGSSPLPDYTKPRTWGGLALIGVAALIAVIDVMRTDVEVNVIQFGLILGSGLLLLGVEGVSRLMKP